MISLKLLVIGLGSMGRRRARLTEHFFPGVALSGVDSRPDRREEFSRQFNADVFDSLDEAFETSAPDAVAVCTSPDNHGDLVPLVLKKGIHTFSELDLLYDGYDAILSFE